MFFAITTAIQHSCHPPKDIDWKAKNFTSAQKWTLAIDMLIVFSLAITANLAAFSHYGLDLHQFQAIGSLGTQAIYGCSALVGGFIAVDAIALYFHRKQVNKFRKIVPESKNLLGVSKEKMDKLHAQAEKCQNTLSNAKKALNMKKVLEMKMRFEAFQKDTHGISNKNSRQILKSFSTALQCYDEPEITLEEQNFATQLRESIQKANLELEKQPDQVQETAIMENFTSQATQAFNLLAQAVLRLQAIIS
jgi:hypothetical protein